MVFKFASKITLLFLLLFSALTACKKNQFLVDKIAGHYKIERLTYKENNRDSVATITSSVMYFDQCSLKDQQGGQRCQGYYEINGKRIAFEYWPEKISGKEEMHINIGDFSLEPFLGGSYEMVRKSKLLTMNRYRTENGGKRVFDLQIILNSQ